jgi:hypothetical protein
MNAANREKSSIRFAKQIRLSRKGAMRKTARFVSCVAYKEVA